MSQEVSLPHHHGHHEKAFSSLPQTDNFEQVAGVFKQLSDPVRCRIFLLLCHSEECVINISALVQMSSSAVSHHLKQLRAARLIISRREGKEVYYMLDDEHVKYVFEIAMEHIEHRK